MIIAPGLAEALAVHYRAPELPIIGVGLPSMVVDTELFASLQRPGGKVTGFSYFGEDLAAKRVELLREFVPSMTKVAILHNYADPLYRAWGKKTEAAAQGLDAVRLELQASSVSELATIMARLLNQHVGGLIVVRDFLTATLLTDSVDRTPAWLDDPCQCLSQLGRCRPSTIRLDPPAAPITGYYRTGRYRGLRWM